MSIVSHQNLPSNPNPRVNDSWFRHSFNSGMPVFLSIVNHNVPIPPYSFEERMQTLRRVGCRWPYSEESRHRALLPCPVRPTADTDLRSMCVMSASWCTAAAASWVTHAHSSGRSGSPIITPNSGLERSHSNITLIQRTGRMHNARDEKGPSGREVLIGTFPANLNKSLSLVTNWK